MGSGITVVIQAQFGSCMIHWEKEGISYKALQYKMVIIFSSVDSLLTY